MQLEVVMETMKAVKLVSAVVMAVAYIEWHWGERWWTPQVMFMVGGSLLVWAFYGAL